MLPQMEQTRAHLKRRKASRLLAPPALFLLDKGDDVELTLLRDLEFLSADALRADFRGCFGILRFPSGILLYVVN